MPLTLDEKMAKAKGAPIGRSGGNYITGEGLFEVEIIKTMRKMGWNETFTARTKELFIVEFKITKSESPNEAVKKAHAPGTSASWTCKNPSDDGAGDVKSFVLALAGVDGRTVKESDDETNTQAALLMFAAMGEAEAFQRLELPENWFVGQKARLETRMVTTKAGKPFTKHTWSPVEVAAEEAPPAQQAA